VALGEEIPLERGHQRGYPPWDNFSVMISAGKVKTASRQQRINTAK